jgi:hypothetical protein
LASFPESIKFLLHSTKILLHCQETLSISPLWISEIWCHR